jgi:hypothetical protein
MIITQKSIRNSSPFMKVSKAIQPQSPLDLSKNPSFKTMSIIPINQSVNEHKKC